MSALRLALALCLLAVPLHARVVQSFYRVHVQTDDEFNRVLHQGVMVVLSKVGEYVDIVAPDAEAAALRETGLRVELVQSDLDGMVERMRRSRDLGAYTGHEEMRRQLHALERRHPDLVHVETIGDSWETLRRGADRPILAVRVARDVARDDARPEVLFFAGVHAREIATTEILMDLIRYLIDRQGRDPRVDHLLTHRSIWFIPALNPDGREYALRTDIWWRKNRHEAPAGGPIGVDLNRNFGFRWGDEGHGSGSSADPHSSIYRGTGPFSEPEAQALRNFVKRRNFVASLAYHSYGKYLMYPYGFSANAAEDRSAYDELAAELTRFNRYRYGNVRSTVGYYSSGRHDDWLYGDRDGKGKIMAMEIELGRSFFPPEAELPRLFDEVLHTNLTLARRAGADPEISWDMGSSGRLLQVRVINRGLLPTRNFEVVLVSGARELEVRKLAKLDGLLERRAGSDRSTLLFKVPDSRGDLAGLKLRISYVDGGPIHRELPIAVPAD